MIAQRHRLLHVPPYNPIRSEVEALSGTLRLAGREKPNSTWCTQVTQVTPA